MPNVITVCGRRIEIPDGCSISVTNNRLFVDGVEWTDDAGGTVDLGKVLEIKIEGNTANVHSDRSVTVGGSVAGDVRAGGSVTCNAVGSSVQAGGSVNCGSVTGGVQASGSVRCGTVGGSVRASGSVRHG